MGDKPDVLTRLVIAVVANVCAAALLNTAGRDDPQVCATGAGSACVRGADVAVCDTRADHRLVYAELRTTQGIERTRPDADETAADCAHWPTPAAPLRGIRVCVRGGGCGVETLVR